ncbi:alpha/beta fold hydrolase [Rurimicrobium arvi]|uniref:Alpha/beta hydrolase n=1 Tax=Rurimicrobium arvi TaxID=2049916 RepID=A0ABP8ME28_9BACT
MEKKETFVLVHAAWLGGWQWDATARLLTGNGHKVFAPDLPGHGSDATPAAAIVMEHYVAAITTLLDSLDEPVILVGHSFNGITVSRVAELRPEKVRKLVFLTAFLLPQGASFLSAVQGVEGSSAVDHFYLSEDKTYAFVSEQEMHHAFAHDIPREAFDQAKAYIVPEPAAPLTYQLEVSDAVFGAIPKFYIECTEDHAIPLSVQRAMYTGKVKRSYLLNASHTPNFSQPEKLAAVLLDIASVQ